MQGPPNGAPSAAPRDEVNFAVQSSTRLCCKAKNIKPRRKLLCVDVSLSQRALHSAESARASLAVSVVSNQPNQSSASARWGGEVVWRVFKLFGFTFALESQGALQGFREDRGPSSASTQLPSPPARHPRRENEASSLAEKRPFSTVLSQRS